MAANPVQLTHEEATPREIWAWAMYDFANSGYTTVVITAVFNAYFVKAVAGGAAYATFAWTAALSVSYALIILTAPLVGAYADAHAAKKKLLFATTVGCVLGTAALSFVGPGQLWLGVVLIVISNFFFGSGENLAAAFLPEISKGKAFGKISGWGWSLGYVGGLLTLAVCLAYVTSAQKSGATAGQFVPVTMLITAVVFALAAAPTFLFLRERAQPNPKATPRNAFAQIADSLRRLNEHPDLRRFLICLVCYQAGVQTVIALAAIYAQEVMHFSATDTIVLVLLVNITAAIGAFAFGMVQDRLGHVLAVAVTLVGWILMVTTAWFATTRPVFWIAANLAGLCMGSSQSAGRAMVAFLSPKHRSAEFFALWGLAVKLSSILGPLTYGVVTWATGNNHRLAIIFTGVFFVAGLVVLRRVNIVRGRNAARLRG